MKNEMQELKHPYVGTEHLLLAILHDSELHITKDLVKFGLTYDRYRNEIIEIIGIGKKSNDVFLYTPLLKRVIENTMLNNKDNEYIIEVDDLFISLLDEGEGIANRVLLGMNIDIDFLYDKFSNDFSRSRNYKKLLLDDYAFCLNDKYNNSGFDPVIGRDEQVNRVIEILLRRTKNNPVLVGEAGVGKTAIVEELVRRIELKSVPRKLFNVKIYSLSLASLIAGTKYRGEFEERINQIIDEVEGSSDIILFIDEIHTLVGAGGAEGAIDASNILKPYLARGSIRIIGATTKDEYSKFIEDDKALDRRFQKVSVFETSIVQTRDILFKLRHLYEQFHGVIVGDEIIENIILYADKYVHNGKFPDKAIDIFDEVCAKTSIIDNDSDKKIRDINYKIDNLKYEKNKLIMEQKFKEASLIREQQYNLEKKLDELYFELNNNSKKIVNMKSLYQVIYNRTKIPIEFLICFNSKECYKKLSFMVLGHNKIINEMLNIIEKHNKSMINVPLSFLFVGKSGVGKTFLARKYAELVSNEESFVKLDMNEYSDDISSSKIIGGVPGYVGFKDIKSLCDRVAYNPYSIILLDNIDKASYNVLNLFRQIFEEGAIHNSCGELVDFSHCLFFMTSNYGCNVNKVGFTKGNDRSISLFNLLGDNFCNVIYKYFFFEDLNETIIRKIILSKCHDLSTSVVDKIVTESNYINNGARKIDKLVEKYKNELIKV